MLALQEQDADNEAGKEEWLAERSAHQPEFQSKFIEKLSPKETRQKESAQQGKKDAGIEKDEADQSAVGRIHLEQHAYQNQPADAGGYTHNN